ncbi:MAG: hypothetical protein HY319_19305 [Armatimonadetes bacterium]|nr:hypothetical protein [Armatimonadota bacterium]
MLGQRFALVLLVVSLGGCTPQPPTPPATPPRTGSPAATPDTARIAPTGRFVLHTQTPVPATVTLEPDGDVTVAWAGDQIEFRLEPETLQPVLEKAAAARKVMAPAGKAATLLYEGPEGTLSSDAREVELLWEAMESLVPHEGLGPGGSWAVGSLQKSELEGGFHQIVMSDQNLVISGKVPPDLVGKEVMITGRLATDQVNIGMTGPTYEVDEVRPWPPAAGK